MVSIVFYHNPKKLSNCIIVVTLFINFKIVLHLWRIKVKTNGCKVKAICSKEFESCKYYKKMNRSCKYYEYKNSDSLCNSIDAIDEALTHMS